jgi:putative membrane protein
MLDALLAYAHHLAAFTIIGVLVAEWTLVRPGVSAAHIARLVKVDAAYGAAAVVLLAAGFARVYLGAKGHAFYAGNAFYWTKLGLFAAAGLVSIVPTVRFFRWNRARKRDAASIPGTLELNGTRRLVAAQLLLIAAIPLCAVLMARGIGIVGAGGAP